MDMISFFKYLFFILHGKYHFELYWVWWCIMFIIFWNVWHKHFKNLLNYSTIKEFQWQFANPLWCEPHHWLIFYSICHIRHLSTVVEMNIYLNLLYHNLVIMTFTLFTLNTSSNFRLSMDMMKREKWMRRWMWTQGRCEKRCMVSQFEDECCWSEHQKWISTKNKI